MINKEPSENKNNNSQIFKKNSEIAKSNSIDIPSISLPKGGGAIKSIDEKFEVNAVNGSANFSVPLPTGSARGFGTSLGISYNSGSGNGIFGMGWSLNLPSIRRKTEKELPQYHDQIDSDTFVYSGSEDLVPLLQETSPGSWSVVEKDSVDKKFTIKKYRPRIEGAFARIERWTNKSDGSIHWRVISKDNVTSIFGDTSSSRIENPDNHKDIFEWFIHFSFDDKGNCVVYEYLPEDSVGIDTALLHNKNRINGNSSFTNTYLKRVRSGNINPYNYGDAIPPVAQFLFETLFDYGELDKTNAPFNEIQPWPFRNDAFSDYHAGFEIRNCRLCERVLLTHYFKELPGGSALVSTLNFKYDNNGQIGNFTFLKEITSNGFIKQADNTYTQKSLPPVSFNYQKHEWDKTVKFASRESMIQSPSGIYEPGYKWVDLFSEGLNGILTEQGAGLFYKQNLGAGNFSAARLISPKPSFKGIGKQFQLEELEADGAKYLSNYEGVNKGFFKLSDEGKWLPFKSFEQIPNIDFKDPNTKFIDLDGNGKAEILITEDNLFSWYPSLGETGFELSRKVWQNFDDEKGPHVVFNDEIQSIFLSDMNGDGLTDIVRIKNGSVCYWPNLGYGKFGAKVSMDNAPVFDHPDQFNPSYIKLADIDGSGTTDIVYLGKDQFKIWLNQSGNSFLPLPEIIDPFPEVTNLSQVAVVDFLGNGTGCIVWSSSQPKDQGQPLRYIDLTDGKKPHLMIAYRNNMGKEVKLEYTASTYYYLQDELNGTPWVTKLPFPVHCLSKVVTYDRIMKTRFASEYTYHHGYYDHAEREFRGFGRVEQKDAEDIINFIIQSSGAMNNVVQEDLHQPPVLIKTWFHTGAFLDQEKILNQFAHEYSQNSIHPENLLPEPELPAGFSVNEWRQALRACKSMMLRKEIYALDNTPLSDKPYSVDQQNCLIQMVQPQQKNKYASFLVLNSESISYHYERDLSDPRIGHSFVLEVDEFANIKKTASIVYKRKNPAFPEQAIVYATYSENEFTNFIDTPTDYRTPLLYQTKLYELTGLSAPTGDYYTLQQIKSDSSNASFIDYEMLSNGTLQKRLVDWSRSQFRGNNGTTVLLFGTIQSKALLHQTFKAAFDQSQLSDVFNTKISFAKLDSLLLDPVKGGYIFADNYYWVPSAKAQYDITHFFLPVLFTDLFGSTTKIQYDNSYHLFIENTTDALGNEIIIKKFNYRVLQPYMLQDINDNLAAVRFDELGIPVKTFVIGKKGIDAGDEFDDTVVEMSPNDIPFSEMEYHVFEWFNQSTNIAFDINNYKPQPNFIKTKVRETHYNADPLHQTKIQEGYTYFGGGGEVVLKKVQAEPGEALQINPDGTVATIDSTPNLRWVGNGRIFLNNKGNPVKQYEPYLSIAPDYDDEKEMVELGVTPVIHYDPLGRTIRTDAPNKTFSEVEFYAWEHKTFDANDTVAKSGWYDLRIVDPDPGIATPEEISAAQKAFTDNDTPMLAHLDTLGRAFFAEADNVTEKISSHIKFDIEGKELEITDALNRKVMQYDYDLLSRNIEQISMDAGTRWMLMDAANKPLLSWDDLNHEFSFEYDQLRRPLSSSVKTGNVAPIMFGRIEYGEFIANVQTAKDSNLRGVVYRSYDQSGILTTLKNDFKGNLLSGSRQLTADYRNSIDWTTIASVVLEKEIFTSISEYDSLSRPIKLITPHSTTMVPSEVYPRYNEANLMDKIEIKIRGAANITTFVSNINYDAKAQREEIFYGNGTKTKYTYEKETFRLKRLLTTRNNGIDILQDLNYTYDPVGNVIQIKDNAQPDIFYDNENVQALNTYEYDAIYRLISATGRKHAGQTDIQPKGNLGNNISSRNHPFINSSTINPNDANAFRNYTETFKYDKAGNMKEQKHVSKNSSWTRTFEYDKNNNLNNRLTKTTIGSDDYTYTYDPHGNMVGLETILNEVWDFIDHFKEADLGGGGNAYYVYDAGSQRVRKVIERQNGIIQERIYLSGIEIYREKNNTGNITLERETLHVMDDKRRIAMVDTPVISPLGSNEVQLIRYQYDNHLGSASLELDDSALTISYEEYFPFGATSYSTIDASREVAAKRYRYTGKERDEESGLNYHGARYYALWLCRWTAADPFMTKDGLNVYSYVSNNPVRLNDPNGKEQISSDADQNNPLNYSTFEEFKANALGPTRDEALKESWDKAHPEQGKGEMTGNKGTTSVGTSPVSPDSSKVEKNDDKTPVREEFLPSFTFRPKLGEGWYGNAVPCQAMHCHQPGIMNAGQGPSVDDVGIFLVKSLVETPVEAVLGNNAANAPSSEDVERGHVVKSTTESQKLLDSTIFFATWYAPELLPAKLPFLAAYEPYALAKGTFTGMIKDKAGYLIADEAALNLAVTSGKAGRFDYAIHGNSGAFWITDHTGNWLKVSPERVAEFMKIDGYPGGPVRLLSCEAGACVAAPRLNPAQRLANVLNEPVLAPTNKLWVYPDGKFVVGPHFSTPTGGWTWFKPNP
jgi:RHS repeat-associated protein